MGLDHQWLGFFQYTTGWTFARYGSGTRDPYGEFGRSGNQRIPVRVFDPRANWLLNHEEARPYGKGSVLSEESESGDSAAGGETAGQGKGAGPSRKGSGGF